MLKRIYKSLVTWFSNSDYQSGLESFIANQNPKNIADVEHLERVYSARRAGGMI